MGGIHKINFRKTNANDINSDIVRWYRNGFSPSDIHKKLGKRISLSEIKKTIAKGNMIVCKEHYIIIESQINF